MLAAVSSGPGVDPSHSSAIVRAHAIRLRDLRLHQTPVEGEVARSGFEDYGGRADAAEAEGLSRVMIGDIVQLVQDAMWEPEYGRIQASRTRERLR